MVDCIPQGILTPCVQFWSNRGPQTTKKPYRVLR
jgi:hypothetical protein